MGADGTLSPPRSVAASHSQHYIVCILYTQYVPIEHHEWNYIIIINIKVFAGFFCTGVLRDLGPVSDLHNKSYFRLVEKNSQKKKKKITILMFIFVQITSVDYRCMWVACVSFDISEFKFELDDFDVEMY